ncbi:MAG: site-specific DNA-methyltransferase [Peptostreptococcaceae bacterium]|nr:site-specific DNA-methyltransferase [Peptostreptococcaceae bacterium]
MRSARNKTIDISVHEGKRYLQKCISITEKRSVEEVLDKTILGDLFEVAPFLPTNFVDLLIVDPPYNIDKDFNGKIFKRTSDELYEEYTESWIKAILPLLKEEATIYVCCDWRSSLIIGNVLKKYFYIRNRITWQREKGRGALMNWKNGMEDIWFGTNSKNYTFNVEAVKIRRKVVAPYRIEGKPKDWEETGSGNFRNTYPSNFWDDISIPYWSMPENTAHPTQKPEKLLAKMILASSNPGDVVFDPFLGSGSTSVTAKKLNRHYVGIEINEQYCVWAEKRLEIAEQDDTIQGYTEGVFWERNTTSLQKKNKPLQIAMEGLE